MKDDAELAAAGLELRWLVPGADPNDYDPGHNQNLFYEEWRDREREQREEEERSYFDG